MEPGCAENRKWLRRRVSPAGPAGEVGGEGQWGVLKPPCRRQSTPKGSAGKSMVRRVLWEVPLVTGKEAWGHFWVSGGSDARAWTGASGMVGQHTGWRDPRPETQEEGAQH